MRTVRTRGRRSGPLGGAWSHRRDLREGIPGASLDGEAEEEQSEEEQNPGSCGAYFRVHDEYDEGRVKDAMDRDEADCRRGWAIESGVQHGPVRADCAIAVGVVSPRG